MSETTIDLSQYHDAGTLVLSGRPKGEAMRKKLALDDIEKGPGRIKIIVPKSVVSLNSSFFLGLFTPSIRSLGIGGFEAKYGFECNPAVLEDIETGKVEALNQSNPLKAFK